MQDTRYQIHVGDAAEQLALLPADSVQTCVTSPPYWGLRDYGNAGQIGLESTPEEYVARMVAVFRKVRRVLRADGTCWINIGDTYERSDRPRKSPGLKTKDLVGIPWRLAFALQADGWYLRQDIIWAKRSVMPENVRDRCTKAHEYVFLLSKSPRYFYDAAAVSEPSVTFGRGQGSTLEAPQPKQRAVAESGYRKDPGLRDDHSRATRNKRSVWTVASKPYRGAHFAVMPPGLVEPCIRAGSRVGDLVLDPFTGSGTTGAVALAEGRRFVGVELNEAYAALAHERIRAVRIPLPVAS